MIPEENFDFEHLQKLSTRHNPFPKARQAYAAVQEHADGKLYEIPGEAAYVKALSLALKKAKSDEQSGEDAKENDREHTTSLSESELDLIFNEPRTQVESETDDLESE